MDHVKPEQTDEQIANCRKLAAYLRTLPVDYPDFQMATFTVDGRGSWRDRAHSPECGTAACAAGHGPAAGIAPLRGETWDEYSRRAFVENSGDAWDWCFSASWVDIDNTAHGAAARIEYMLDRGVPLNADEQMWGDDPISYTVAPA